MADHQTLGRVARLYYEHGLTQVEIAELLSVSRIKVTRTLAEARREGIVEITVHSDAPAFGELEQQLVSELGLRHAWIAPAIEPGGSPSIPLGKTGARALRELLPGSQRVVIGLSESVLRSLQELGDLKLKHLEVYPLAGGRSGRASGTDPGELGSTLAHHVGGTAFRLPAPLIASSAEAAHALMDTPGVRQTLEEAAAADLMIVGIGGVTGTPSSYSSWATADELAEVHQLGAVGDISAHFFDSAGKSVVHDLDDRVVGLSLGQMASIRTRLAIAGGTHRLDAIRSAVSAGLVNALVTDTTVATALLEGPR